MKFIIATLFISGVLSAPFSNLLNTPESSRCDSGASRFHSRKSLLYAYEGETLSGVVGTSAMRSGLKLRAKCEISPVLPCVYMLKVIEAELLETQGMKTKPLVYEISPGSSELRLELLARELYFRSDRGVIGKITPDKGEPTHILNIKRGILSAFQLKMLSKDDTINEVDVNGECKANYHIKHRHRSGKVKTIVKTKNLSVCNGRSQTNLGISVTPYPTDKPFSFLTSNSVCTSVVSTVNKLAKVYCEETHLFRPFSSKYQNSSGAMTTVRQTLSFVSYSVVSHDGVSLSDKEETTLKYEHSQNLEKTAKNDREVRDIIEKLVSEDSVKPDSARLFSKLIFAVRRLNMKAMKSIWYRYYECEEHGRCLKGQAEKYQKYIIDAFSHCGTLDCAQFMVNTISEKKVGTQQSIAFLTGIALVGTPSENMVGNILFFCQETPSRTAFLTLGTLVNKYCRQHNCDKLNDRSSIYQADRFLQSKLNQNCKSTSPEDVDLMVLTLKAIGNAGRPLSAVTNLLKCAVEPASIAIKIEALQALRRIPCSTEMTKGLFDIFKAPTTDTEVRIETYLALMRCPSEMVIQKIADQLDNEKNNQVGSFVWSHLTNALESTEPVHGVPLRDIISKALAGRELRSFNIDRLRYSHAYETSYYNKKQEVGASGQAQVIFHPDSYFPRSAKFNLTVDVLGASINLLETAARFEGFESLIEQMFGSEGYFPDDRLMNLLKVKPTSPGNNFREGRSIKEEEMDEIKSSLEKLQDKMKIERKNPSGALSFKVFGHELQFLNFDDIDWLQGEADKINVIDTLINIARGGQYTFTKSFMFLEADYEVPTAIGLPLKLAVNGSAVSSLNLKGKFDIRNMFWGKKKFDIRGYVTPSAVIDISGKITVDAKHASSGIHVNSSLYTSTEINANATYKEGEGIKMSIDPPSKPIYIVNVTSNLATFLNEKFERLSGPPRRFERQACANLTNIVGVNLCGHISTPMAFRDYNAPYFPLTGQSSFAMTFQTINADLARFEMEGRKVTSNDDNRHDWIFNVHIPGLTFGKRMETNCTFQLLKHGKYLHVSGGIHGYKFGKFEAMYNNDTNGLYTKFSSPELAYLKPITIESEVFNKTNTKTNEQKVGISVNATYNNFTIQEVITLFKDNDHYGFKSNLTYWPRMHIATEGRLSVVKKSVYLKMDDTISKSKLFFAGKLGQKMTKFYVKIGNAIMNYEVKLDGELNMKTRKLMVDMFTKPSRNLMKFEAYPRLTDTETGFYMRLLNVNTTLQFSGYLGASHTETESSLKFNGIAMNKPIVIRATRYIRERKVEFVASGFGHTGNTYLEVVSGSGLIGLNYNASFNDKNVKSTIVLFKKLNEMGLNLNASLMDKTVDMFATYFRKGQDTGLRLKLTGGDKTIDTVATYFTGNEEKGLKFAVNGMGQSGSLIWAYYNKKTETGLSMKASGLDRSVEIAAGVFTHDSERGLRVRANVFDNEMEARWSMLYGSDVGMKFAASAFKKNIELKSAYRHYDRTKMWRIDAVYNGNMKSLVSTYTGDPSRKTLCSELSDSSKVHFKVCTEMIRSMGEIALQLSGEGFGRKGEVRTSLIRSAAEKGGRLQVKYNDAPLSDVFVGMVASSTYNGLRLRANVSEKSMDALLKYTSSKRSVDFQLSVQGNLVSFESMWVREASLQGLRVNVLHQNQAVGSAYALLSNKTGLKVLKIGATSARKNGAEYKLSIGNSRIEKKLHSMFIVMANEKHYKYGWSIVYMNKGTSEQPNRMITSRLHYGHAKFLTSVYQMINTEHSFSLISKEEVFPGRFVTNKFAYSKLSEELFIQQELVPGMRMTYSAALQRTSQLLGLRSTLTILDYPMNSSIILDKQTGRLRCTFAYSPTKPPVELTSHLQIGNKIDVGFLLSALNMTWDNMFLLDYSLKQVKLAFNVLPNVQRFEIFAKMFDNNQFVFNITTCSALSVQLTGRPTKNEYQLIFRHQFYDSAFDDLKVTTPSLQVLKKLQLKWDSLQVFNAFQIEFDSKMTTELRKVMNISMQNLLTKTIEITKKMAIDSVNYMKNDGRDFVKMAKNFSMELLKGDKINNVVKKYSSRANEMVQKLKETMINMTNELKKYGSPLMETYKQLEKSLKEITSELSPHLKSLPSDIRQWLRRSFDRYRMVSICGKTIEGITWESLEKINMVYKMFVQKCKSQITLLLSTVNQNLRSLEMMKITAKEFTCNYDMKCTLENVQNTIKKRMDNAEMKKMGELLKKISEPMVGQFKTIEKLVSMQLKNSKLQEMAEEFLRAIKKALKSMATNLPVERMNMLKKMSWQEVEMLVRDRFKLHYKSLMQQVGPVTLKELQDKLKMLVENILIILRDQKKQVLEKIRTLELHEMMRRTRAAAAKIYEETAHDLKTRGTNLYPKLMNKLKDLLEEAKKIIKEYVELVKSRVAKFRQEQVQRLWEEFEKVKRSMREGMSKYKNQLTLFADKRYQNVLSVVTSYKDMPIEDIFKNLDKLTRTVFNNASGTVMEATLSVYRRASDYVQKMDFQYLKFLEARCKMIFDTSRDILLEYTAVTEKKLKPMLKKFLAEIEKIGDRILSYSKTRYNEVKLSYDKIKYIKFIEMYGKARKILEEWNKEMEKCREICRAKVNEWKTNITNFIKQVKEESINVASRVRKVNEEVQQDAIATFRPYELLVKSTLNKHKRLISERMAELPQHYPKTIDFVNKYRKAVEDCKSMVVKNLINIADKKEIIDMVLESLNRSTLLAKYAVRGFVVKSQEFVKSSTTKLRKLSGDYEASIMKFANDTRDKMALRMEKFLKDLEYVGEANLYVIEVRVMEHFEKILAPAKSAYKKLSNIVEKQLKVLAEKRNALKDLSNELYDKARVIVADGKQLFKDMSKNATEWTTRWWANNKPLIDYIVRVSGKFSSDVEMFATKSLYTYGMFIEEYYKELLKMTPNQLIQRTKQMCAKSYDLSRRLLETVKTNTVDRLRMSLRALLTFIDEFDTVKVLQQAKLKAEIGALAIRSILQDAGNQMRSISTEIVETLLFLNRFYGIEETVYSRIPLRSLMVIRLNQVKEKVRDYLNANVRGDAEKIYTKVMAMINNMTDIGRKQYTEIVVLVKKLNEKYPNIAKYKNVTKLFSDTIDCLRKARVVLRGYVTANFEYCMKNKDIVMRAMRQIKVALYSGEYKLALSKLDVIYKIGSNATMCLRKQYAYAVQLVPMMPRMAYDMYKDTLRRLQHVAKTNLENVKQDLTTFQQSSKKIWTPVRESFTKNLKDVDRMRRESMNVCTTIAVSYYNKGKDMFDTICKTNIRQVIANYTKTLSKEADGLVDNMKTEVSEMIRKIRMLRKQAMDKNWKMDIMNLYESTKTNPNRIIEDLMNKTIEISQDFCNLSLIQDLLKFGRQCYSESNRVFGLTKESSEFALYITNYVIQHSGIWDVARKLTDPFFWLPPSNSIAMIFGTPHVYTFDGKYFKFPGYNKPTCTYVLAHDFRDKNFTLLSREKSLILNTKSGHITIDASGKVEATVNMDAEGNEVKVVYNELPVEMMHVRVHREASFIKIHHDQGLDVTCDLKHFLCTFNINRFYHGKIAGLLGTNNNELYDEFTKSDKSIAETSIDFVNSWEVSGDPECKVTESKETQCDGAPRCDELFLKSTSPLARYFSKLNPEPFYHACVYDTSDCDTSSTRSTPSHCNVMAAYTTLLREKGVWARQLPECASCGSNTMWKKWTQKGNKGVDVVLLVPETLNIQSHAVQLPAFLRELETGLGGYKPRYAVVGFGGKSGVHQLPHIVTGGGNVFGTTQDVGKAIENMKFTNEKADALKAIEYIQRLPFNAGATKVVILLTDQNRGVNSTGSMTKAIKTLNMHGMIFNVIGPYFQRRQQRSVLGLWKKQAYLMKEKLQSKLHTIALPSNDYTRLAESSQGGIFNLEAYSQSYGKLKNSLGKALKTTLLKQINNDQVYCRQCVCVPSFADEPVTFCRVNKHARC